MAVEARGWKRQFAGGLKENGLWRATMYETGDMLDTVEGVALALSDDWIKVIDEHHNSL